MAMKSPSSSSSFSYRFKYQVFLSFRGSDTRYGFTGNLYNALTEKGIHTFIDDRELQRGDEIKPSLENSIEESRIFVPVFSANYASSSFCLDELVHIIHCYKTKGRLVLPIFFGVDPTNVRHHTGSYGEALAEHEKRFQNNNDNFNLERLQKWKKALTQAANLSGDHRILTPGNRSYEYKFIGEIVKYISNKISREPLNVATYPVGLDSQVQQVISLLDKRSDDGVHMVGIYGVGGLGKSTLARAVYNFVADQFEGLCFLHDVRENSAKNSLKHLQEKLLLKTTGWEIELDHVSEGIPKIKERLCRKKILLILDDVDNIEQLHALAGGHDWFGRGSRVIITTQNKHLLSSHGIESTHAVEGLNETKALELLRWMAFKSDIVPSGYEEILNRAVAYASGLPLVIVIVGSNLFGKSVEEWKGTLDGYEKIPNKEIQKILKVSYDALEEEEQSVFLDIACCFKRCAWEKAKNILNYHYGHHITHHLSVLYEKSLIDQNYSHVTLHNLIEDMGKEIVRQESPKEPGERSRLWHQVDIVHVLNENNGTSKIEMIYMNFPSMESIIDQKGKAFKKMTKLKTLIIENGHFSEGLKYLPSSLIVLKWERCLEEIRGIPPNLKYLVAFRCKSLSSSTRRMLLSQKLHEAGCTNIFFPNGSEGIPDWFEHQSREYTISFWFRKKIPSITSILLFPESKQFASINLFVNGYEYFVYGYRLYGTGLMIIHHSAHAFLFDLELEEQIKRNNHVSEMNKALLENEWIHVVLKLMFYDDISEDEKIKISSGSKMGIHVLKDKSDTKEDVIFTNPYTRKRNLDEYLNYSNTSLSQFEPPMKKQRLVEVLQHLALLSLVLTEAKEKEHHD